MTEGRNNAGSGGLAYRLRGPVRYSRSDGQPMFLLSYPLKAARLHPVWMPLGDRLSSRKFVSLRELEILSGGNPGDRLRLFLDGLVRRGFLESRGVPALSQEPRVSVIVPVHNRPAEIQACLETLLQVDYPPERMEILVVDDASTDRTPEVVAGFPVTLIRLPENRQAPFCRNLGARRAGGEILAFIDSDCLASSSWLRELVPLFQDRSLAAVGGKVEAYDDGKGLDRYEQVMSSLNGGDWPRRSSGEEPFFYVPSCNFLIRRESFLSVGGFQEDLQVGEDVDLCWRLQDRGHPVEYRPFGIVYHRHRNRMKDFCSRRFDYGTSEPWLQCRHSHRIKRLILSPAGLLFWVFFIAGLLFLSAPLTALSGGVLLLDARARFFQLRRQRLPLSFNKILAVTGRNYGTLFYHWAAFISRYYLFLAFPLILFRPLIALILAGLHLLTAGMEYFLKRPRLNFFSFLFYFTGDQLSYQLGAWWGCLKNRCFRPVNPLLAAAPPVRES
jgi:mycofactocin system glycosyltransferase